MQIDKLSDTWLFQQHSRQTVKEWLRQFHYFYFTRAWGGHANDGDTFKVGFLYTDKQDLISKLGQLSVTLNTIPDDFPRPKLGHSYPSEEFEKFKNEIKQFKTLEQPGHSIIFGHKAFIWISDTTIEISISGTKDSNPYYVSEDDFKVCLNLEKEFDKLDWLELIDKKMEQNVCCISMVKYPELYKQETTKHNETSPEVKQSFWKKLFN
jgi:hypothetical protein